MRSIVLISILIVCLQTATGQCYTKKCKTYWNSQGNSNNLFYYKGSYGGDIHPNPLQYSTNQQFRVIVQRNIGTCNGQYCERSQFVCQSNGNTNCYHVEHIIDENGPEFANCQRCKDISGNMIMAAGDWNKALGGLARSSYNQAQSEKILIYGSNIVQRAKNYITNCCRDLSVTGQISEIDCEINDGECDCSNVFCGCDCSSDIVNNGPVTNISTPSIVGISITILVIIILTGLIVGYLYYRNNKLKISEQTSITIDKTISEI
jgi:hypothetical protein